VTVFFVLHKFSYYSTISVKYTRSSGFHCWWSDGLELIIGQYIAVQQ